MYVYTLILQNVGVLGRRRLQSEIEVLQDQRSSLIAKINSVNDVIGNSKVITNVFQNTETKNTQVIINDPNLKKTREKTDINTEIRDIFSKKI